MYEISKTNQLTLASRLQDNEKVISVRDVCCRSLTVLLSWTVCYRCKFHFWPENLRLKKVNVAYGAGRHMSYHHACPSLMAVGLYGGSCHFLKTWNPWSAAFRLMEVSFGNSFLCSSSGVAWAQMRWFELTKIFNSDWCTSAAERNWSVNSVTTVNDLNRKRKSDW